MKKLVDKIFRRYGVPITIQSGTSTYTVRGFVQHTATSARRHLLPEYTPLGQMPQGHYLMLLPLYQVNENGMLMYNGKWFIVRRMERVWLGSIAIYDWCLCEERGERDLWGK
jgi:hypothetical protein